jgi:hypothetical protein
MFKKRPDVANAKRVTRELPRWRDDKKDFLPGEYGKQRNFICRRRWSSVFAVALVCAVFVWKSSGWTQVKQRYSSWNHDSLSPEIDIEDVPKPDERTFQVLGKDGKMRTITIGDDDDSWTRLPPPESDQPSEKTVEKPAETPAQKPSAKPVDKPAKLEKKPKEEDDELDLGTLKKDSFESDEPLEQKPIVHKKKPSSDSNDKPSKFVSSQRKVRITQKLTAKAVKHGDVGCKNNCDPQGLTYARQVHH